VPPLQKGLMGSRAREVGRFFEPFHLQHDASSDTDLEEDVLSLISHVCGGGSNGLLPARSSLKSLNEQPTSSAAF